MNFIVSETQQAQAIDYKQTLNLPETSFKMKAGAREREPEIQAGWEKQNLYKQLCDTRLQQNAQRFLLHDGPPYLSANKIHIGTALNKILKDIVIRYKWQRGYHTPYVPGYDGHGLPIENAILQSGKAKSDMSAIELRRACGEFAMSNLKGQEAHFKRLGILGHWEKPYVTIDGEFEAAQLQLFWTIYEKGYVYKGLKPVYWDTIFQTALAEAEVEYQDVTSPSIYVKFELRSESVAKLPTELQNKKVSLVIWTTTPWTIPGNTGLCVNPDLEYVFIDTPKWGVMGIAEALLETVSKDLELVEPKIISKLPGLQLEKLVGIHPLYQRDSLVVLGDHVTTDAGTGVVHTAPGHGMEDYLVGKKYGLDVLCPVDVKGLLTAEAGEQFQGLNVIKKDETGANAAVIKALNEAGALLQQDSIQHSYPHSWRSHKPVIYRATDQWFVDIEKVRADALAAIDTVEWLPERGRNRIFSMVENRGDWCISRQRAWGVPIPIFYCASESCREPLLNKAIIDNVTKLVAKESTNAWWTHSIKELLGADYQCVKCGHSEFDKENDIMDVWFDSGVTHTSVVEARSEELGHLPVELYLEGSDQHRGWFQSSLLTSVMAHGKAPYKSVLTHGFVLDENGRKMSKSLGNVIDPEKIINEYGADVLRLWVASVDFTNDVRIGANFLQQLADVYKKVRNTIRFILGNLNGFDPKTQTVSDDKLSFLDRYTLEKLSMLVEGLTKDFDNYTLHSYYQGLQNFCVNDLSALYFDVTKDILYTCHRQDPERLAVQTVLYELLATMLPLLVPVMPHLAEDIWQNLPENQKPTYGYDKTPDSILLAPWPLPKNIRTQDGEFFAKTLRDEVNLAIEPLRSAGDIGSSLETQIKIEANQDALSKLGRLQQQELERLLIVSNLTLSENSALTEKDWHISAQKADGDKCGRCWRFDVTVGQATAHPTLCHRCHDVVQKLGM